MVSELLEASPCRYRSCPHSKEGMTRERVGFRGDGLLSWLQEDARSVGCMSCGIEGLVLRCFEMARSSWCPVWGISVGGLMAAGELFMMDKEV